MTKIYFNHISGNIHPVYQELFNNLPHNFEFINKNEYGLSYEKNIHISRSKKMDSLLFIIKKLWIFPNISFKYKSNIIQFSCQIIPFFGDYILDLDCYESLNRFSGKISRNYFNRHILKFFFSQKRCKKIILWSENAKIGFQSYLGKQFDSKIEVLYPSIDQKPLLNEIIEFKKSKDFNVLFVGRYFKRKGGELFLEVAKKIIQSNSEIHFYIISEVESSIIERFTHHQIHFLGILERQKTLEYFKKADVFLLPTFQEIFGMVLLEAISYGAIPIALDTYAVSNIIVNNKNGYIIDYKNKFHNHDFSLIDKYNNNIELLIDEMSLIEKTEIIKNIEKNIIFLYNNPNHRKNMIEEGYLLTQKGKFSINERNKKLLKIFV